MLEMLANAGEFIGGIGVLFTLIYLAVQVRQNSHTVKSAAAESVMKSMSDYYMDLGRSENAWIILHLENISELDEPQQAQAYLLLLSWFRLAEIAHHHHMEGHLPDGFWAGQERHLAGMLSSQSVAAFWQARKMIFSDNFQTYVDSLDPSLATLKTGDAMRAMVNTAAGSPDT